MIHYQHFTLKNGLEVYVHEDHTTPIAVMNVMYNVGSKDETSEKTGFAHLFEHLMFRGSQNISNYDEALQLVGGENNAFTSQDLTNYYLTLPANNIETGFWLESDRMLSLSFEQEVLETEKNVVIEEFKQRYLNQPYGDVWLHLYPLSYQTHPYQWATIGKTTTHIANATMEDVKDFFFRFYRPNNAFLVIAGNVKTSEMEKLANKWFGNIPAGEKYKRNLPKENLQIDARHKKVNAKVPLDAIYKTYHVPSRMSDDYRSIDLLSDILGRGKSSRLYQSLVKGKQLFNSINAYVTGNIEPGLLVINGKLNKGVSMEEAEEGIEDVLTNLKISLTNEELEKVKSKAESSQVFSEVELLNRAINIAYFAMLGDASLVNKELEKIQAVDIEDILKVSQKYLQPHNSSTLYYMAE